MSSPIDRVIAEVRKRGWTQEHFAREVDETSQTITNWKKRGLPPCAFQKVARLFGWSVDQLLADPDVVARQSSNLAIDGNKTTAGDDEGLQPAYTPNPSTPGDGGIPVSAEPTPENMKRTLWLLASQLAELPAKQRQAVMGFVREVGDDPAHPHEWIEMAGACVAPIAKIFQSDRLNAAMKAAGREGPSLRDAEETMVWSRKLDTAKS